MYSQNLYAILRYTIVDVAKDRMASQLISDIQREETSFGIYVYLTAAVTSLFDSKQINEDLAYYYN